MLLTCSYFINYNKSKSRLRLKRNFPSRYGVGEGDALGVEVHSVGLAAVEFVADDGAVEAVEVGAMDAELMRAARGGVEVDEGFAVDDFVNFV